MALGFGLGGRAHYVTAPVIGAPAIIQQNNAEWPGQNTAAPPYNDQSLTRILATPGNVTSGNSIVVFACTYNLGQTGHNVTIADSQGNTWPAKSKQVDDTVENLSWLVFCLPRLTASGAYSITATFDLLEWQSLWITEVSNLAASPVIDANGRVQTASGSGGALTDQLSTTLAGSTNTGIMLAVCHNTADGGPTLGTDVGLPNIGTGFTQANTGITNWHGVENSHDGFGAACISKVYSSAMGTLTPSFSPKLGSENYLTLGIALKGA